MYSDKNQAAQMGTNPEGLMQDVPRADEPLIVKPIQHYSGRKIRKSMWHYLLGRGLSGIGSLAAALLIIRSLSVEDYGAYTALWGLLVSLAMVSDAGLPRVLPKFLPILRMANAESKLAKLCWKLLSLRTIFILVVLIPVVLVPDRIASVLSIDDGDMIIWPFSLLIVLSAVSVHLAYTLQALLQQSVVTKGMILECFTKLAALLLFVLYTDTLVLNHVIWIQTVTIGLGVVFLVISLQRHLQEFAKVAHPLSLEYTDIPRQRLLTFAWHNYLPGLINISLSEGTIKLVCAYYLGITQTASLGFAYAISGLMRQYLPAVLMLGLIEPAFMARYHAQRDFTILNEMASIIVKCNIFLLAPVIVWLLFSGTPLISLITGGKYLDTVWLLAGLMSVLMLYSHYMVLILITNTVDETWLLTKCQLWAVLFAISEIVAMIIYGLPGLLVGALTLASFMNLYLSYSLRSKNYPYKPDWQGLMRIITLAIITGFIGSLVLRWLPGISGSFLALMITIISFLFLTFLWKPFKQTERNLLNRLIGRELIVW